MQIIFSIFICLHFYLIEINQSVPPKWIVPLTISVWMLFLYGFWRIGDPFPLLSVSHGVFTIEQVICDSKSSHKGSLLLSLLFYIVGCVTDRCNWCYSYGNIERFWCCKLSIHKYDIFHTARITNRCINTRTTSITHHGYAFSKKETNRYRSKAK